jgi:hypothetical protein
MRARIKMRAKLFSLVDWHRLQKEQPPSGYEQQL